MNLQITDAMRDALRRSQGGPVDVEDLTDQATYVLIPKDAYLHLRGLQADLDAQSREQLRLLIQEGIDSGPGIPAEEAFARLRQQATKLSDSTP